MPEAYPDWVMSPSGSGPDTKKPRHIPGLESFDDVYRSRTAIAASIALRMYSV